MPLQWVNHFKKNIFKFFINTHTLFNKPSFLRRTNKHLFPATQLTQPQYTMTSPPNESNQANNSQSSSSSQPPHSSSSCQNEMEYSYALANAKPIILSTPDSDKVCRPVNGGGLTTANTLNAACGNTNNKNNNKNNNGGRA